MKTLREGKDAKQISRKKTDKKSIIDPDPMKRKYPDPEKNEETDPMENRIRIQQKKKIQNLQDPTEDNDREPAKGKELVQQKRRTANTKFLF